jgi:GNAT superfamily N-acetyltransferase
MGKNAQERISVKLFTWEHWIPVWQLRAAQLAEHGIIIDPENIPRVPSQVPEHIDQSEYDWDLVHIGAIYLCGRGGFWLAWCGDTAVGHVGAQDLGGVAELRRMYVRAASRRRGIGTRLVWALIAHCAAGSIQAKELWTAQDGPGRALYEKLGFRVVDEPGPGFEHVEQATGYTRGADEIRMRLDLIRPSLNTR